MELLRPSLEQASRLKKYSQEGKLNKDVMDAILTEERTVPAQVTLKKERLKQYFPQSYTQAQMEEVIFSLTEDRVRDNTGRVGAATAGRSGWHLFFSAGTQAEYSISNRADFEVLVKKSLAIQQTDRTKKQQKCGRKSKKRKRKRAAPIIGNIPESTERKTAKSNGSNRIKAREYRARKKAQTAAQ